MTEPLIEWTAPEYVQKEHSADWYWGVGLTAVALIGMAIVMSNILFGIFIFIATISVFYFSRRTPHTVSFALYPDKLSINKKFYSWGVFSSFWVRESIDPAYEIPPVLVLREKRFAAHLMTIPLPEDTDLDELRDFLSELMEEEEHHVHLSEQIMDKLGF